MRFKIFVGLVFGLTVLARFFPSDLTPANRTPDEKVYLGYIEELAQQGYGQTKALLDAYASDPHFLKYPPPTRVGYLSVAAGVAKLSAMKSFNSAILVSRLFSIFALVAWIVFAWRFLSREIAVAVLFFLGFSPLDLALANHIWPDAFAAFWSALLFWMAAEWARRSSWRTGFAFTVAVFVSILTKEFGVALSVLAALGGIVFCLQKNKLRAIVGMQASLSIGVLAAILLIKLSFGELSKTWTLLSEVGRAISTNPYALQRQDGGVAAFLIGLFLAGPAAFIFFWVGLVRTARLKSWTVGAGIIFIAAVLVLCAVPYSVNLRYLSGVYGLYYLMAAYGLEQLSAAIPNARFRKMAFFSTLILLAVLDFYRASQLFSPFQVTDLVPTTFFLSI